MGVNTDVQTTPFQPLPPKPGTTPSGIAQHQDIRGMANRARQRVTNRQRTFMNMVADNMTAPTPAAAPASAAGENQQQYLKMGSELADNRDLVDRFVDWVLFE
jgi:hypothetical protein